MLPPSNVNQNVYIAEIQSHNRIPEKREEVWSSAKKMPFEMATREINLKISDVNPRRQTEVTQGNYLKYMALNNSNFDRKPLATVNPINHEIQYSSAYLNSNKNAIL